MGTLKTKDNKDIIIVIGIALIAFAIRVIGGMLSWIK